MSKSTPKTRAIIWIAVLSAWMVVAGIWLAVPHGPDIRDASKAVSDHSALLFRDPDSPSGGNPEGEILLVEFFDYNCSHCRLMTSVIREAVQTDNQLRIVFKEYPILSRGSLFAARAALASRKQGKYQAFHRALMEFDAEATEKSVLAAAVRIGLDIEKLKTDMRASEIDASLDRNLQLGRALQISGAPTIVVGKRMLSGSTDLTSLRKMIQTAKPAPG